MNNFGKIGVIMGGVSSERGISIKSATAVLNALRSLDLDAVGLSIDSDDHFQVKRQIISAKIDCAFVLLHGYFGEDGQIQQILESLAIPFTGSGSFSSAMSMDKFASKEKFSKMGIRVPQAELINNIDQVKKIQINPPWVVKPCKNGSSYGLSIVNTEEELNQAFLMAKQFDEQVLIEEYIRGKELTVGVLHQQALPIVEIITASSFFDFKAKYEKGLTKYIVPAVIPEDLAQEIKNTGLKAHMSLGCSGFSRTDIILKDKDIYVLELNSIPGMTDTSLLPKAAKSQGIEFSDLCLRILQIGVETPRIKPAIHITERVTNGS